MEIFPIKTPIIKIGDDLFDVFCRAIRGEAKRRAGREIKIQENSIIVIASKVVSITEGCVVDLRKIKPSKSAKALRLRRYGVYAHDSRFTELVMSEADQLWPGENFLTIKKGIFAPSAGIDISNAKPNHAILWPKNPYVSAEKFLKQVRDVFHVRRAGVIIADSFIAPLRKGVLSIAIGYAGFKGVEDLRGKKDIHGAPLRATFKNYADSLACAASVYIGEANERIPFALIKNAPVKFTNKKISPREILMSKEKCLYKSLYK